MANYRSRTVLVYDHGLFCELAVALSKDFGRVLYYVPWEAAYPKSNVLRIGDGIKGIERVPSPWPFFDEIDLWVFPDVYEGALQEFLIKQGKRVWGARMGEELELDRVAAKEHCEALGIDIGPYEVLTGIDALRKHLKKNDEQWVKISATRGDMETFHAPNYALAEPQLDELEHHLGAKKKVMEFIAESGIDADLEVGYDGYCIDGEFPKGALCGVEVKDRAYIGKVMRYSGLPEAVKSVNDKLADTLKAYGYRGFISTEIRCAKDGKAYLIDPCARCPSPPSELYPLLIGNLADILWEGAEGNVVEPEYLAKFGAQILLCSDWADDNWQQISFPSSIRDHVKLRNMTVINGEYCVIPQWTGMREIGSVVAVGDTADEAIEECKRFADMVDGLEIEKNPAALDEANDKLKACLSGASRSADTDKKTEKLLRAGQISPRQRARMLERA